jgi:hypothetical protein
VVQYDVSGYAVVHYDDKGEIMKCDTEIENAGDKSCRDCGLAFIEAKWKEGPPPDPDFDDEDDE